MQDNHQETVTQGDRTWLIAQLEAWPRRVDEARTTNIEYLMKSAAKALASQPSHDVVEVGRALIAAIDQMVEDTTPIFTFAEPRFGPYNGKQIGPELEAFRAALASTPKQEGGQ